MPRMFCCWDCISAHDVFPVVQCKTGHAPGLKLEHLLSPFGSKPYNRAFASQSHVQPTN